MSHQYSMKKKFRPYEPGQLILLPPSIDKWLPERHMTRFLSETIDAMDISYALSSDPWFWRVAFSWEDDSTGLIKKARWPWAQPTNGQRTAVCRSIFS